MQTSSGDPVVFCLVTHTDLTLCAFMSSQKKYHRTQTLPSTCLSPLPPDRPLNRPPSPSWKPPEQQVLHFKENISVAHFKRSFCPDIVFLIVFFVSFRLWWPPATSPRHCCDHQDEFWWCAALCGAVSSRWWVCVWGGLVCSSLSLIVQYFTSFTFLIHSFIFVSSLFTRPFLSVLLFHLQMKLTRRSRRHGILRFIFPSQLWPKSAPIRLQRQTPQCLNPHWQNEANICFDAVRTYFWGSFTSGRISTCGPVSYGERTFTSQTSVGPNLTCLFLQWPKPTLSRHHHLRVLQRHKSPQ